MAIAQDKEKKMNCTKCNGTTSVLDSRRQETSAIKRRRKCGTCGYRFNTLEQLLTKDFVVKTVIPTEIVKTRKPKIKPIDPFNDDAYLDSLSDDELEELIGG